MDRGTWQAPPWDLKELDMTRDLAHTQVLEQQVIFFGHCPQTMFFTSKREDTDKTA